VVGGLHALAFVLLINSRQAALGTCAVAGFAMLVWIFVQMAFVPFSPLQAVYFGAGLGEILLVMFLLDARPAAADPERLSTPAQATASRGSFTARR
jgi:hypothetical protein